MASATARHRRPPLPPSDQDGSASSSDRYSKDDKGSKRSSDGDDDDGRGLSWLLPMLALGFLRHMSASSNIVHDCDEVFNYWEPLHYVLYKSGFQTWEYRQLFYSFDSRVLFVFIIFWGKFDNALDFARIVSDVE